MSFVVNGVHLLGAALGFWLIARLARSTLSDCRFFAITGALSLAMGYFLFAITEPANIFEDFFSAYLAAGRAVLSGPEALRPLLQMGIDGFVNLPIVAYLFTPFALGPWRAAAPLFLLCGIVAPVLTWYLLRQRYEFDRTESGLTLFALACFGPFIYGLREGNTSQMLLVPLVGGLVLAGLRRDFLAGMAFAVAAIIKPPFLLIGIYYLLRGRFRLIAGGLTLSLSVIGLSYLIFGYDMHVLWLREMSAYGGQPMPGFNAQSIASAFLRGELGVESYRNWIPHKLPPLLYVLALAIVFALAMIGVWVSRRASAATSAMRQDIEPLMVLAFICVASTVSWSHYYVWLLPPLALLFVLSRREPAAHGLRLWVIAAYALAAPAIFLGAPLEKGIFGSFLSSILVSHLLIAGLLVYGLLIKLRAGELAVPVASGTTERPAPHTDEPLASAIPASTSR